MIEEHNHNEISREDTYVFHNEEHEEEKSSGSKLLKVLVMIVILFALFFISIGIVRFVPKAINSLSSASVYLSSIFSTNKLTLIPDKEKISSEDTINFSWKNTSNETGEYTWSFKCTEGVTVLYKSIDGSMQPVICETYFPIPEQLNSYNFLFTSNLNKSTKILTTLTLWDKETKSEKQSDSQNITIVPKGEAVSSTKEIDANAENNASKYNPAITETESNSKTNGLINNSTQDNNTNNSQNNAETKSIIKTGASDLSISLIQVSAIQNGTQNLVPLTNVGPNDRVTIRFRVSNNGINATGQWRLRANLPTSVIIDKNYISPVEPSLNPGEFHDMTMIFDSYDPSINQILIYTENTNDTNLSNNKIIIPISGYNTNNINYSSNLPDLAVHINSVGVLNKYNNQFLYTNSYSIDDRIAVKFDVENLGGQNTGYWYMRINIPTQNGSYQTYGPLPSLSPGQKTSFTIGFDNTIGGNQNILITADYNNSISEYNKSNNTASQSIYINYYMQ